MANSSNINHQADQSSEEEDPSDNDCARLKSLFKAQLDRVRTAGSFATAGLCPIVPMPALNVEGLGPVGLPLNNATAKAIINCCHRAPFGKGTSTLRYWEVCASLRLIGVQEVKPLSTSRYVRLGSSIPPSSAFGTQTGSPACKRLPAQRRMS